MIQIPKPNGGLSYSIPTGHKIGGADHWNKLKPNTKILGNSKAMAHIIDMIERIAPSNASVLILGENGVGKELIARALHERSLRAKGPFVSVNCAALPDTLIESELFGSKKGAFTGADRDRMGRFEAAHGGSIFLDEVGDLSAMAQAKILRALQEKEVQRLGEELARTVDCRVVAATNKALSEACRNGSFREDLYYRLAVAVMEVPPLRKRTEDIPLLVDCFLKKHSGALQGISQSIPTISPRALRALMSYPYPGNVRQLENAIEFAILMARGGEIDLDHLPKDISGVSDEKPIYPSTTILFDRLYVAISTLSIERQSGVKKPLSQLLRVISVERLCRFLASTGGEDFSRQEFNGYLSNNGRGVRNKYATAGRYLQILSESGILIHNGKDANKSRYRIAEEYIRNS